MRVGGRGSAPCPGWPSKEGAWDSCEEPVTSVLLMRWLHPSCGQVDSSGDRGQTLLQKQLMHTSSMGAGAQKFVLGKQKIVGYCNGLWPPKEPPPTNRCTVNPWFLNFLREGD